MSPFSVHWVSSFCQARISRTFLGTVLYSTLLCSTLLYSTLLYSTLLCSTLLCSTLLYSTLLYSALLYSALLCSTLLHSTLLYYTGSSTPARACSRPSAGTSASEIPSCSEGFSLQSMPTNSTPNYSFRYPAYHQRETIRPLVDIHWRP